MEIKNKQLQVKEILLNYEGSNNLLLDWKYRITINPNYTFTPTQIEYTIKYHTLVPKVVKRPLKIIPSYAKELISEFKLTEQPEEIWCQKLLCESDKAFNIWGMKLLDQKENYSFWVPKNAIIPKEKKLNRIIDYSKYSHRPPMDHQKTAVEKLMANDRFILADDMGVGKSTSATLALIESNVEKCLIICPASLKINWMRELQMYTDKKICIVEGKVWDENADIHIMNYDIIKNYHFLEEVDENKNMIKKESLLENQNYGLVLIDEAHYLSNANAKRTKLMNDFLDKVPIVWLLTGTPMTSRPINYYNLLSIIRSPLASNWQYYVKRFCGGYQFKVGNRKIWNTSGASHLDELRESTRHVVLRRLKNDVLDLPDKIISPRFIELESNDYEEELEEFIKISSFEKHNENLSVTLNRLMKVRQIISFEKIPYTCEIIDSALEHDKKVIVFTNFTKTLDTLHKNYKKNSVILDGRMSKDKRQVSVDEFQNNPKVKIIICNIIAGGVGITLTASDTIIMNDLSFVPAHHSQAEDRAYRYGQTNKVTIYYPIFENTIEKIVYNILQKKKDIIDQVMGDGEYSESFSKELITNLKKMG